MSRGLFAAHRGLHSGQMSGIRTFFLLLLLLLGFVVQAQEMPENDPRLTILPAYRLGISPARLMPGTDIVAAPAWPVADTSWAVGLEQDILLFQYSWLDLVWPDPRFDLKSGIGFKNWNALNSITLPTGYPTVFEYNGTEIQGIVLKPRLRSFYLDNRFYFHYGTRGSLSAFLDAGWAWMSPYGSGQHHHLLPTSAFNLALGLGWQLRLSGGPGNSLSLGADLGFGLRNFTLESSQEGLRLPDATSTGLTPIRSLNLSGVTLQAQLELGEFLRSRYIPYRDPYQLRLGSFGAGVGLTSLVPGESFQSDSAAAFPSPGFLGQTYRHLSVDLFRYNWLYSLVRQADMDLLSGVSLHFIQPLAETPLPDDWATDFRRGSQQLNQMNFFPRLRDVSLDHELIYPLGKNWFLDLYGGRGWVKGDLYRNKALLSMISSKGSSWSLGGGLAWTFRGEAGSKVTLQFSGGYKHLQVSVDADQKGTRADSLDLPLTPLSGVDLSQPVFQVKLGLSFGGNPNRAFRAHQEFRKGNFSRALELQEDLLKMNPQHHNARLVKQEMEKVRDSLSTAYYREVAGIVKHGGLEEAYGLINMGMDPRLEPVRERVSGLKSDIALQSLRKASWSLKEFDFASAEDHILLALRSDPSVEPVAVILLGRSFLVRAAILVQAGVYDRALVWLEKAASLTDRYDLAIEKLRRRIGDGRLEDANTGILHEDRVVVYDAMQDAKQLNPLLSSIVDKYLGGLDEAIRYYEERQIGPLKQMAMDDILNDLSGIDPADFEPRVGMKAALVKRFLGDPDRRFREAEYELWVYGHDEGGELWLYLQNGTIQKKETR